MILQENEEYFIGELKSMKLLINIKRLLQKSQVLYMLDNKERFDLYLDTSIFATGSVCYQIQNGLPR